MMPGMPLTSTVQMTEISGSRAIEERAHHQAGGQFVLGLAGAFHGGAPAHQAGGEEDGGDDAPAEGVEADQGQDGGAERPGRAPGQCTARHLGSWPLVSAERLRTGVRVEVI